MSWQIQRTAVAIALGLFLGPALAIADPQLDAAAEASCKNKVGTKPLTFSNGRTESAEKFQERFEICKAKFIEARADSKPEARKGTECNEANATNYKACQSTEKAIKENMERSQAVSAIGQTAVTTIAGVQSMRSKGTAEDAQKAVSQITKQTAIAKFADAATKGYGATELYTHSELSASEAETLKKHSVAMKDKCGTDIEAYSVTADGTRDKAILRQKLGNCFSSVSGKPIDHAATENLARRLNNAQDETLAQSKAAKSAAIQQGLSAGVDALVAYQALQMSKQANQQATDMRSLTPPSYRFNPGGGASSAPGKKGDLQDDLGIESPGGSFLSGDGARGVPDRGGPGGVQAPSTPLRGSKSSVSGSGGAGGGPARGGTSGRNARTPAKTGPQKVGSLDFGSGVGSGGGRGPLSSAPAADPGLMDAMKCLIDPNNCKGGDQAVVLQGEVRGDSRVPASEGGQGEGTQADLSIFEQINAKYRALAARGSI